MYYEKMWKHLKEDIKQQNELSDNIAIDKLLTRIEDIEEKEKQYWNSEDLLF